MKNIHIIGTGGLAKELIGFIESESPRRYNIKGCWGPENFDAKEFNSFYNGSQEDLKKEYQSDDLVLMGVTEPALKEKILSDLPLNKYKYLTYIHPTSIVSKFTNLGEGCLIGPYAILTGNVFLDDFVYVSYNSIVGHDTSVGKFTTLYPFVEVCGHCDVGKSCVFGIKSVMLPSNTMKKNTKLDAGSILRDSFEGNVLLSGNPAKIVHKYK